MLHVLCFFACDCTRVLGVILVIVRLERRYSSQLDETVLFLDASASPTDPRAQGEYYPGVSSHKETPSNGLCKHENNDRDQAESLRNA